MWKEELFLTDESGSLPPTSSNQRSRNTQNNAEWVGLPAHVLISSAVSTFETAVPWSGTRLTLLGACAVFHTLIGTLLSGLLSQIVEFNVQYKFRSTFMSLLSLLLFMSCGLIDEL